MKLHVNQENKFVFIQNMKPHEVGVIRGPGGEYDGHIVLCLEDGDKVDLTLDMRLFIRYDHVVEVIPEGTKLVVTC